MNNGERVADYPGVLDELEYLALLSVRRLLVEAAWHYRHRPAVGVKLRKRREGQSPRAIAIAPGWVRWSC